MAMRLELPKRLLARSSRAVRRRQEPAAMAGGELASLQVSVAASALDCDDAAAPGLVGGPLVFCAVRDG